MALAVLVVSNIMHSYGYCYLWVLCLLRAYAFHRNIGKINDIEIYCRLLHTDKPFWKRKFLSCTLFKADIVLSRSVLAFILYLTPGIHFGRCLRTNFMLGEVSMAAVLREELLSSIKSTHFGLCVCLQLSGIYLSLCTILFQSLHYKVS